MDYVEDCGYDNLSLSRVIARVLPLKSTPLNIWVMWVYIVWVEIRCIRYNKIAKQNVSRVSRRKALPARHLRKPAVTICHDSSHSSHVLRHVSPRGKASHELPTKTTLIFNLP